MRNVVITGASTGIGEASSLYLAERGFRVFAGVRRDSDGRRLEKEGSGRIRALRIDVTDRASIEQAAFLVDPQVGASGLSGLVNNAGMTVAGPLEFLPLDDVRHQLEVNLMGAIAVTQAFLPLLRRARGRVVNIGSISGRLASPLLGPYAMSKFALRAFSDSMRRELTPWGIRVSLVEPGAVDTPIWGKGLDRSQRSFEDLPPEARRLYGSMVESVRARASRMAAGGLPATAVAQVVHRALTRAKPRARYLVGADAKITAALVWALPDRVIDWLTQNRLRMR